MAVKEEKKRLRGGEQSIDKVQLECQHRHRISPPGQVPAPMAMNSFFEETVPSSLMSHMRPNHISLYNMTKSAMFENVIQSANANRDSPIGHPHLLPNPPYLLSNPWLPHSAIDPSPFFIPPTTNSHH